MKEGPIYMKEVKLVKSGGGKGPCFQDCQSEGETDVQTYMTPGHGRRSGQW